MADQIQIDFERGNDLSREKQWARAVDHYRAVLDAAPDHEWALNNIGFSLFQLGRHDEAIYRLKRAIAVNPRNVMAHANLVAAMEAADQRFEAIPYRRRLTELKPDVVEYSFALANTMLAAGRIAEALNYYRRTMRLAPEHRVAVSNYLLALNYAETETVERIAAEHFRLAQRWARPRRGAEAFANSREPQRKLRIGYLSCDFSNHPVGKTIHAIIAAHDRSSFEVHAYSDSSADDHWTGLVRRSCAEFTRVAEMSDDDLEARILSDQIDILVELAGHTGGRNRLGVLAGGVAPMQMSFLGYPNTTGLLAIDYRITDSFCDPPGRTEHLHSEQLIRLNRGFLCYSPPENLPAAITAPVRETGQITFGSFNNPTKVSASALAAWARILAEVPGSRLAVKYGGKLTSEALRERWREHFACAGVDPDRLEFYGPEPTLVGHFERIGRADIALDPFPYQGTMTSLETLSMGVPLITLAGETYSRRASSALLMRLGFDDLVATTVHEYVETAVELARSGQILERLRSDLRERFLKGEICDVKGFVAELEHAYRGVWQKWCTEAPPPAAISASDDRSTRPLVVLCSGMPRSGSTWSYNVCRLLLEAVLRAESFECGYHEGSQADEYLMRIQNSAKAHLVKLHYPGPTVIRWVNEGRVKNIFTIRHPLDALASFKEKFGDPVATAAKRLRRSLEAGDVWRRESATLFVEFAEIMGNARQQIRRIAAYLDFDVSDELVERIHQETCLETVRKITQRMADTPQELVRAGNSLYDPRTQYHLGHAPKAENRDWQTELTPEEQLAAQDILGPWLAPRTVRPRSSGSKAPALDKTAQSAQK